MRFILLALLLLAGCSNNNPVNVSGNSCNDVVLQFHPSEKAQEDILAALIKAKTGITLELAAGTYSFNTSLSLTVPGVTIRGAGMDQTILSFKEQDQGKEGILVTGNDFKMEGLTIEDTKGDALKINGATNVTLTKVRARWTGGPAETNGAYGLYPVQCSHVIIDGCEAECASDAGIYVGQSKQVIVKNCKATRNVAGIEIENCTEVDVFDNYSTNNTGGLLVFDLPDLPAKNGKQVRVFRNTVIANNHRNFAPKGNIVATVPPGTGMMVLASDQVELFQNQVKQNNTTGLSIISYHLVQKPIQDKDYDPYPEGIYVHDNVFEENGNSPGGEMGLLLTGLLGKPLPDILYDGNTDPKKQVDGKLPEEKRLKISNQDKARFVNLNYTGGDILKFALGKPKIERNIASVAGTLPALPAVELK